VCIREPKINPAAAAPRDHVLPWTLGLSARQGRAASSTTPSGYSCTCDATTMAARHSCWRYNSILDSGYVIASCERPALCALWSPRTIHLSQRVSPKVVPACLGSVDCVVRDWCEFTPRCPAVLRDLIAVVTIDNITVIFLHYNTSSVIGTSTDADHPVSTSSGFSCDNMHISPAQVHCVTLVGWCGLRSAFFSESKIHREHNLD